MYRVKVSKIYPVKEEVIGMPFPEYTYNYDKVEIIYTLEKKRQYWWGWSHVLSSTKKKDIFHRLKVLSIIDNCIDEIVYFGV